MVKLKEPTIEGEREQERERVREREKGKGKRESERNSENPLGWAYIAAQILPAD